MSQKALFVHISDRRCRQSWVNKPSCESCTNGHVNDHCISNFITASEHFKSSTAQLHSFHSTYPTLQKWCAFSNAYSPQDTKDSLTLHVYVTYNDSLPHTKWNKGTPASPTQREQERTLHDLPDKTNSPNEVRSHLGHLVLCCLSCLVEVSPKLFQRVMVLVLDRWLMPFLLLVIFELARLIFLWAFVSIYYLRCVYCCCVKGFLRLRRMQSFCFRTWVLAFSLRADYSDTPHTHKTTIAMPNPCWRQYLCIFCNSA